MPKLIKISPEVLMRDKELLTRLLISNLSPARKIVGTFVSSSYKGEIADFGKYGHRTRHGDLIVPSISLETLQGYLHEVCELLLYGSKVVTSSHVDDEKVCQAILEVGRWAVSPEKFGCSESALSHIKRLNAPSYYTKDWGKVNRANIGVWLPSDEQRKRVVFLAKEEEGAWEEIFRIAEEKEERKEVEDKLEEIKRVFDGESCGVNGVKTSYTYEKETEGSVGFLYKIEITFKFSDIESSFSVWDGNLDRFLAVVRKMKPQNLRELLHIRDKTNRRLAKVRAPHPLRFEVELHFFKDAKSDCFYLREMYPTWTFWLVNGLPWNLCECVRADRVNSAYLAEFESQLEEGIQRVETIYKALIQACRNGETFQENIVTSSGVRSYSSGRLRSDDYVFYALAGYDKLEKDEMLWIKQAVGKYYR